MSHSEQAFSSIFSVPISIFKYPPSSGGLGAGLTSLPRVAATAAVMEEAPAEEPEELHLGITLTEEALSGRLALARAEATYQTEQRLHQEYEARLAAEAERIAAAVRGFERERNDYFARVEVEVVQLALSIAGKILHRESQVDPMLVAALVRIALSQLKDGSAVSIRVRPEEARRWRAHFTEGVQPISVSVIEDAELQARDCILETELGSANFSMDAQLKEVEQGFFDVLAQRP